LHDAILPVREAPWIAIKRKCAKISCRRALIDDLRKNRFVRAAVARIAAAMARSSEGKSVKDMRERIADAALAILESEGAQAVSMRRIAQEVGVTPMAIYHHYANREALLQALVYREFDQLNARVARNAMPADGPDAFIRAADTFIAYALERPHMFDYIYSAPRHRPVRYPEDFRAGKSPAMKALADQVAAAMARGELRQGDVWEVALQFWAHAHGYLTLYRSGWFTLDETAFRALYRRAVTRLLDGLRASPE
jgi:AcrR family transcriptional regulator